MFKNLQLKNWLKGKNIAVCKYMVYNLCVDSLRDYRGIKVMEFKLLSIEDYGKVYQLWANTKGMGMRSLDDSYEGISTFLKRNPTTNFIAQQDADVVGVILCGHDGRRGYIYHLAVNPNYRRNGIGKSLVNSVIEALRKEEINKVALVVFKSNELGNEFWESVGLEKREDLIYRNLSINENNI